MKRERNGKRFNLNFNDKNVKILVLNTETFKTIQLTIKGWIFIDDDMTQEDLNKNMHLTKRHIKDVIREISRKIKTIQPESIVTIDTGNLNHLKSNKNYQFIKIDICIYNKPNIIFDKYYVMKIITDLLQLTSDYIDQNFKFIKEKVRGTGQYL
jgi:hypothetical protein